MLTASTPPPRAYTRLLSRLGWSLLLLELLFRVSTSLVSDIFEALPSTIITRALYGLSATVAYSLPFVLTAWFFKLLSRRGAGKHDTALLLPRRPKDRMLLPAYFPLLVLAGLAVNLIASEINYYLCLAAGYSTAGLYDPVHYDTPAAFILYMTTALAPAFAEEYLFRGVVYENLRPFGKWQAIIISAMTFSLMHQNVAQLLYTFVCGIVLALMFEWTGSIWCGVFFHLFNNELSVLTESLVFGAYGEGSYRVILIWNAVVVCIGLACAAIWIVHAVKHRSQQQHTADVSPGIFGVHEDPVVQGPELWDTRPSARSIRRALRNPGMMTYIVYSLAAVVIDYLMVLLIRTVGG